MVASLAGGWLVAIALCIPPLFQVAPYKYNSDLGACVPHFAMTGSLSYAIVFTVTTLVIPGALIIGCNIRVSCLIACPFSGIYKALQICYNKLSFTYMKCIVFKVYNKEIRTWLAIFFLRLLQGAHIVASTIRSG